MELEQPGSSLRKRLLLSSLPSPRPDEGPGQWLPVLTWDLRPPVISLYSKERAGGAQPQTGTGTPKAMSIALSSFLQERRGREKETSLMREKHGSPPPALGHVP